MVPLLLAATVAVVLRSLTVRLLQRWNIGAPLAMVVAGAAVGLTVEGSVAAVLNTTAAQRAAELILAILLFVDATEVRGGRLWGRSPGLAARLLLVALPLSLVAAVGAGVLLLPQLSLPVLLVLACVVMPIDFATSESVVRDSRLPVRLRMALNVEGGYNDGIVSPLFVFALALAGGSHGEGETGAFSALAAALPQALIAIVVGLLAGALLSAAIDIAEERNWTSEQAHRIVVVLAPLVSYTAALALGGNGFVATFVCGIAFRFVHGVLAAGRRRRGGPDGAPAVPEPHRDYALLEDVTSLLTTAMWFVLGIAGVYLVTFIDLRVAVFCVLALTVLRQVPVQLALIGSRLRPRERVLAGLLGPRGTTTIVFGLLAFNGLPDGVPSETILVTTVLCVLGSVLLHGLGSGPLIARLAPVRSAAERPAADGGPAAA
ncbi:cation:proton antiporter domain-containing protein [Blastococcus sp. SYSU D00695]